MQVSESSKQIAKLFAAKFGGKPAVNRFFNDNETSSTYILSCKESALERATVFATVGFSETPLFFDGKPMTLRTELITVSPSGKDVMANALASAAFAIMRSGYEAYPGSLLPNILKENDIDGNLRHFLLAAPFLWSELDSFDIGGVSIAPLLAVPITDEEMAAVAVDGITEFEARANTMSLDLFELNRGSVL